MIGVSSLVDSLGYNYLFVLGFNGGIKIGLYYGKVTDICCSFGCGVNGHYYLDGTGDGRL